METTMMTTTKPPFSVAVDVLRAGGVAAAGQGRRIRPPRSNAHGIALSVSGATGAYRMFDAGDLNRLDIAPIQMITGANGIRSSRGVPQ